jgi:hypothetical protein
VTAIYGSDFSVAGYYDREFGGGFAWDTDLLSGYDSVFLSQMASGARSVDENAICVIRSHDGLNPSPMSQ